MLKLKLKLKLKGHDGHTYEDQIETGVLDILEYCYFCGCKLNQSDKPETVEGAPQICEACCSQYGIE